MLLHAYVYVDTTIPFNACFYVIEQCGFSLISLLTYKSVMVCLCNLLNMQLYALNSCCFYAFCDVLFKLIFSCVKVFY